MMVTENWRYMTPVEPPKKAMGPKTAESTRPMPMRALVICSMDLAVASFGGRPSSLMIRSTFSTTTIASSTRSPMDKTMANIVSMLMEKPNNPSTAKVPSRTTGTAMVGISVARMFPMKSHIIRKTRRIASKRVLITS
ncbi:MAG: hypothetical protein A4E60_03139 [Syntrophorhabdus sp. PtaB.Bin047]|nr:MAG: hypothetical protein A4E60_03139 [Syntrophorhabdus sp. PtaB.Bin047]